MKAEILETILQQGVNSTANSMIAEYSGPWEEWSHIGELAGGICQEVFMVTDIFLNFQF